MQGQMETGAKVRDATLCLPVFASFAGGSIVGHVMGKVTNIVVQCAEKEILLVGGAESLQTRSII